MRFYSRLTWALCLSLLVVSLFAPFSEATIEKTLKFSFFQNNGGLNDKLSPIIINNNEASAIRNVNFTLGGAIEKRTGFASDNNAHLGGSSVNGLFQFRQKSGTDFFIQTVGNKIFKMDSFDGTWDDITGALTIASSSTVLFDFTTANDNLIATNRDNPVITWDGSGNAEALSGSPPQGRWVAFHQNIVFLANTSTNPSRIQFSNVLDEETWTSTDFIDVAANDGTEITGLAILLDALYIFKEESIYRLSGTNRDDFVLSRMVTDIGTVAGHSIQVINNKIIFHARDGIYLYDGGINVIKISSKIEESLDDLVFARNKFSVSADLKPLNQYWLSVTDGSGSKHNLILIYDYFHNAWTKYIGIEANAMAMVIDNDGQDQLYTGDASRGFFFKQNSGNSDDGAAIDAFYTTKWYRFPEIKESDKAVRLLRIFAKEVGNWNLTIDSRQDFAATTSSDTVTLLGSSDVYGTGLYGTAVYGGETVIIGRIHLMLRDNFFQFEFSNANADEPFTIYGWDIFVEPQDRI